MNGAATLLQSSQHQPASAQLASDSGKLIPAFDPTAKILPSVDAWITKVDDLASAYGWSDRQTSCYALMKLEAVAKTWYDGLGSTQRTWEEWKNELKKAFPSTATSQQLHPEIQARRKERDESVEVYFYDKLAKVQRCGLSDSACIDYTITGLQDENAI